MYQRILVAVDGSETSRRGLDEAIRLAQLTGARLRLIHAVDDVSVSVAMGAYGIDVSGAYVGDWLNKLRDSGRAILREDEAVAQAASVQVETALGGGFAGPVWDQIARDATTWKADLIVLGTHGRRGVGRALLGSTAEMVARHASVPVLLVRAPDAARANAG
jgi:nucleotide-binding universal stress UspA family protein